MYRIAKTSRERTPPCATGKPTPPPAPRPPKPHLPKPRRSKPRPPIRKRRARSTWPGAASGGSRRSSSACRASAPRRRATRTAPPTAPATRTCAGRARGTPRRWPSPTIPACCPRPRCSRRSSRPSTPRARTARETTWARSTARASTGSTRPTAPSRRPRSCANKRATPSRLPWRRSPSTAFGPPKSFTRITWRRTPAATATSTCARPTLSSAARAFRRIAPTRAGPAQTRRPRPCAKPLPTPRLP